MQRSDFGLVDDPFETKEQKEVKSKAVKTRSWKHKVSRRGLAASTMSQLRTLLTRDQLLQCADGYTNNGIVRTAIDKTVFFTNPERTGFVIEPNEELTEGATDQEIRALEEEIKNSEDIKELRRKLVRINKRCKLHDRTDKLLTSTFTFGRNALEIIRLSTGVSESGNWNIFGEPFALRHLNTLRFSDIQVNAESGVFEGIYYDEDSTSGDARFIPATSLIPAFYDDNNLYDNTNFSGSSLVWPILSVAQSDDVINDEDIPEAVKNLAGNLTLIGAGTNSQSKIDQLTETLGDKKMVVHGLEGLTYDSKPLAGNILQLPDVRLADAKYICMCMSLPLFLVFEDTANFATANQVMQVYKNGMLKRHRTWLQGILEDYWYDPILADHLGMEFKDIMSADIKIKATFPDINFEVRSDIVNADKILKELGVFNQVDIAKDIDRKDLVPRLEQDMVKIEDRENKRLEAQQQQNISVLEMARMKQQQDKEQQFAFQKQQASAAAAIRLEGLDEKLINTTLIQERVKLLKDMQNKVNDLVREE
jgi:hypothetical protein